MNTLDLRSAVAEHSFVHGMRPEHLNILLDGAVEVAYDAGEVLFKEGEPANKFYLVEHGGIILEAHELGGDTARIESLGPDEALGWSWLFPPYVWHFSARAIQHTAVIALNGARLLIRAEQDHDFGYDLMKRVAKILMHRLQRTRHQLFVQQREALLPIRDNQLLPATALSDE